MNSRLAGLGVLLAFSLGSPAIVQAQTAADYAQGVTLSGTSATLFFNPTSTTTTWTDVHYQVNGGALQNLRMARDASSGKETQPVTGLAAGNVLSYSFPYNKGTAAYDSAKFSATIGSTTPVTTP